MKATNVATNFPKISVIAYKWSILEPNRDVPFYLKILSMNEYTYSRKRLTIFAVRSDTQNNLGKIES